MNVCLSFDQVPIGGIESLKLWGPKLQDLSVFFLFLRIE